MVGLEGVVKNINIYNLATVGTVNMVSEAANSLAIYSDNVNVFPDVIALFQLPSGNGNGGSTPTTVATVTTLSTSTTGNATPTGAWQYRGCYVDNIAGRTLLNGESVPGGASAMTVEACQSVCKGLGYTLAGLEYSQECCKYPVPCTLLLAKL
jgi:glucan 1,3-beta-glucosidase